MDDYVELPVEIRGAHVIIHNEDGTEHVAGTYEHLVRCYFGEFSEDNDG